MIKAIRGMDGIVTGILNGVDVVSKGTPQWDALLIANPGLDVSDQPNVDRASAIQIIKQIPDAWQTSNVSQITPVQTQKLFWAMRTLLKEIKQEIS